MSGSNTCPACQSSFRKLCGQKNNLNIYICSDCKSLYTPIGEVTHFFAYDEYYIEDNELSDSFVPEFINEIMADIVAVFAPYRRNNRLLDVGAGSGNLLAVATQAGWQAEGVEVSPHSVDFLKKNNFKIFHGDLHSASFPNDYFDVVTCSEVIEHVPEPLALATEMNRILRPGGLLWATTPHGAGISRLLLGTEWTNVAPPEHLCLFSTKGMEKLLKKAGFNQITIEVRGFNPFEIFHNLRNWLVPGKKERLTGGERVEKGYQLNAALTSSPLRKTVKNSLNEALNITKMGDSMKIWAIK